VDEDVIELIKSRLDKDGLINPGMNFESGDRVVIKEGPLKNLTGIFERKLPGRERVLILLTTVGYQTHVEVDTEGIGRIYQAA
jgi:transcription antitermination factor NusG